MDHYPVLKADDMVTVEGFDVEMLGIAFPMDAGFVLSHFQDFPSGTSTLNGVHVSDSLIFRLESPTSLESGHQLMVPVTNGIRPTIPHQLLKITPIVQMTTPRTIRSI